MHIDFTLTVDCKQSVDQLDPQSNEYSACSLLIFDKKVIDMCTITRLRQSRDSPIWDIPER